MNKAYVYRIYPTRDQKQKFAQTFGCVRFIYNKMLHDRMKHFEETGKSKSFTPAQYKPEFTFLKDVDSLALCNAQLALNKAYKNFYRKQQEGPKFTKRKLSHLARIGKSPAVYDMNGHPKFKSKKDTEQSYSTNNQNGSVRLEGSLIKLPKIGFVKIRLHRELPQKSVIKTVTITRNHTGKYFISILVEYENQVLPVIPKTFIGLDFAMDGLYKDSEGNSADYPRFYRKSLKKLKRLSRKFSRTRKDSKNHRKMRLIVAGQHERIVNRRNDFQHKLSNALVSQYDCICIEDLDMRAMSQALHFGKSVSDNAWGMFIRKLEYKLKWAGKHLVKVDRWYPSSQLCSACGYQNNSIKNLSIRAWVCPECGASHDRDQNAAINIREEGKRLISA